MTTGDSPVDPIVLHQHPLARAIFMFCWLTGGVVVWTVPEISQAVPPLVSTIWSGLCLGAAWRSQGMAVVLGSDYLCIRRFIRRDHFPRKTVQSADPLGALTIAVPSAPSGRRVVLIPFFGGSVPVLNMLEVHNAKQMAAISRWIDQAGGQLR